jgi:selenium metabolism protein YedF
MQALLDCRTLPCPEPVLRTRAFIADATIYNFAVLVDNAAASDNVCRFLENKGWHATVSQKNDKEWRIDASRDGATTDSLPQPPATAEQSHHTGKTLIFISTETLGRGDDVLGSKLMANFLATLPELGSKLWRVVLVNGGVKLAATQGKSLESLQALAATGVSILVCGTCLEHYGLMAAKQVGETTNMLDIVTSLEVADKIIRP